MRDGTSKLRTRLASNDGNEQTELNVLDFADRSIICEPGFGSAGTRFGRSIGVCGPRNHPDKPDCEGVAGTLSQFCSCAT